jgi:hypothetical protein
MDWNDYVNCGCPKPEPSEEEIEKIVREVEEEREGIPVVIPIKIGEEGIPAIDWPKPIRREVEVEVR